MFFIMLTYLITCFFLLGPVFLGCGQSSSSVPLKIIENRDHSGITKTGTQFVVISDCDRFSEVFKSIYSRTYSLPELPTIDFDRQIVLAAFMGQKPTGGYHISFEKTAFVKNETLRVTVIMQTPSEDALLPQVITSPYALAAADRGRYSRIEFVDMAGNILKISEMSGIN